jgi:hypothetical protein
MSAKRRNGRGGEVVVPVAGDVLDPPRERDVARREGVAYPVAQPVQRGEIIVRHEYASPPPVQAPSGPVEEGKPTMAQATAFIAVVCVLLAIGVGLWLGGSPPWEKDAAQQRSVPVHHRGSVR